MYIYHCIYVNSYVCMYVSIFLHILPTNWELFMTHSYTHALLYKYLNIRMCDYIYTFIFIFILLYEGQTLPKCALSFAFSHRSITWTTKCAISVPYVPKAYMHIHVCMYVCMYVALLARLPLPCAILLMRIRLNNKCGKILWSEYLCVYAHVYMCMCMRTHVSAASSR